MAACAQTVWAQEQPVHDPFAEGGPLEAPQESTESAGWAVLAIVLLVALLGAAVVYRARDHTEQTAAPAEPLARDDRYLGFPLRKEAQIMQVKDKKYRYASNRANETLLGSELRLAPDDEEAEDEPDSQLWHASCVDYFEGIRTGGIIWG